MSKFRDQQGRIRRLGGDGSSWRAARRERDLPAPRQRASFAPGPPDYSDLLEELERTPGMRDLDERIRALRELIDRNAITLLEDIARSTHFHDITRKHGDGISRAVQQLTLLDEELNVTATSLTELYATVSGLEATQQAYYQELVTAIADEVSARVSAVTDLHAQVLAGDQAISAALNQRISEVEATAEAARATLQETLAAAILDGDTAVSQALNQRISEVETTAEAARAANKVYLEAQIATGDVAVSTALNHRIDTVEVDAAAARASLQETLHAQFTAADTALGESIDGQIATTTAALNSRISEVEADAASARASDKTQLQAQITQGDAAVSAALNERIDSVEATEQGARAALETTLVAQIADSVALAKTELSADVDAVSATVGQVETNVAALDTALAATQSQLTANVTATQANASSIDTLIATTGEHSAAITTLNQVSTDHGARHTLALNVDGLISGHTSDNDGTVASFNVAAHVFRVLAPGNAADGLELRDGSLRVWRGNVQRILGNGFGANEELVDWFGPNVGTANASKANAVMWMDVHGNAWWGGELSSGPLTHVAQTGAVHTPGLSIVCGPFATNGGARTVKLDLSRFSRYTQAAHGGGVSAGPGSNSASITLYRQIGSAAETTWQTLTASGTLEVFNEFDGASFATSTCYGSTTLTDTSPSTESVRYRAVISAYTWQAVNGTFNKITHSYSLKLTSTEGSAV